jgi:phosphoenolpyruvate-protein phosphotransferase
LASALSVPVIFALGEELLSISDNTEVLLDGQNARLQIEPSLSQVEHLKEKQQSWAKRMAKADKFKLELAKTSDGHRVRVAANLASLQELSLVQNSGAEEIGLFRTEFLFMNRDTAPDEDEQFSTYKTVVEAMKGYPVTIRTMDIGGDKPVPYLDRPKEANPNLGWRGLRHSLDEKELFQTQLAAILRAGAFGKIRIMFPLVSTLEELADAQELLEITKNKLIQKEVDFDENCEVGIMIEVPAAAELADSFAKHVDFFSIGTNDLTQYTMASDRANTKLKYLFDPFQPAVLRTISRVIKAAHDNDIWIGMCGAMAGDLEASSILVGMGLDEFSMNASDIPEFKLACNKLSLDTCKKLADEILEMETVHEIHERLKHNSL